jgi:hypothetical protein
MSGILSLLHRLLSVWSVCHKLACRTIQFWFRYQVWFCLRLSNTHFTCHFIPFGDVTEQQKLLAFKYKTFCWAEHIFCTSVTADLSQSNKRWNFSVPVIKVCVGQRCSFCHSLPQHSMQKMIAFTSRLLLSEGEICQYPFNKRNICLDTLEKRWNHDSSDVRSVI